MSRWRDVQEALYQRWTDLWVTTPPVAAGPLTPFVFENEDIDPPDGPWARLSVMRLPGQQETLGRPGNRKMARVGLVSILIYEPPGGGIGNLSDLGERAAAIFENCRIAAQDIRFAEVEPGQAGDIENGRWWGLPVRGRFDYEELK